VLYRRIEGVGQTTVPLQYVGVYVTRWQPAWGQPTIGFVEADDAGEEDSGFQQRFDKLLAAAENVLFYQRDNLTKHFDCVDELAQVIGEVGDDEGTD